MVRLYLETNFVLSFSTGRDPEASRLVENCPAGVQRVIPSCCLMEALGVLESRQKQTRQQVEVYRRDAAEASRSRSLPDALEAARLLRGAVVAVNSSYAAQRNRLLEVVERFTEGSSVELLATRPGRYLAGFAVSEALDPTGQLILATILDDAAGHPGLNKALLTENRRCFFDDAEVRQAIAGAGIRYFASAGNFLEWYEAGGES